MTHTKQPKRLHLAGLLLALFCTLTLTSCVEEDEMAEFAMMGRWRIVEISFFSGNYCPYEEGDFMTFYEDRTVEIQGRNGFYEYGSWRILDTGYGHELHISFDGYNADIEADMDNFNGNYARLDVRDYYYNSSYTLRIMRW